MTNARRSSINYSQLYQPQASTGLPARNQSVMVSLQFRTLGEARFNYGLGSVLVNDGVRNADRQPRSPQRYSLDLPDRLAAASMTGRFRVC